MVRCPSCSRENEPSFRYCLGCGMPLDQAAEAASASEPDLHPQPTADPTGPGRSEEHTTGEEAADETAAAAGQPRICTRCNHAIAHGFSYCGNCGAFFAPLPERHPGTPSSASFASPGQPAAGAAAGASSGAGPRLVPQKSPTRTPSQVQLGVRPSAPSQQGWVQVSPAQRNRSPSLGAKSSLSPDKQRGAGQSPSPARPLAAIQLAQRAPSPGMPLESTAASAADAWLTQIRSDGREGGWLSITPSGTCAGRTVGGNLFEGDPFLSPLHATFWIDPQKRIFVRDEGSLNGTFLRVRGEPCPLLHGDIFRVGQELLRFEELKQGPFQPDAQGTMTLGSPIEGAWGRLCVLLGQDRLGDTYLLTGKSMRLGRERGEIVFPEDGFVSGLHAELSWDSERVLLRDLGSSNGTYLRLRGETRLLDSDFLLLGQQLFMVRCR